MSPEWVAVFTSRDNWIMFFIGLSGGLLTGIIGAALIFFEMRSFLSRLPRPARCDAYFREPLLLRLLLKLSAPGRFPPVFPEKPTADSAASSDKSKSAELK